MKVKLTEPGFENLTGVFGRFEFVDGVSVEDLSELEQMRIGNIIRCERMDGTNPSSSQQILDSQTTQMDQLMGAEITVAPETATAKKYTREELEKVADEGGIEALRKISDPLGIKSRSISALVEQILTVAGDKPPAAEGLLGSSVQPSFFEINGNTLTLGDVVRTAFEKSKMTTAEWNQQTSEARELAIAEALKGLQGV